MLEWSKLSACSFLTLSKDARLDLRPEELPRRLRGDSSAALLFDVRRLRGDSSPALLFDVRRLRGDSPCWKDLRRSDRLGGLGVGAAASAALIDRLVDTGAGLMAGMLLRLDGAIGLPCLPRCGCPAFLGGGLEAAESGES
jgi:hypothetical protein